MTTESLTYRELADRLGVKLESARKTVQRKRWQKVAANDGTIRILVPVESLPSPRDMSLDSPGDSPLDGPSASDIAILEERIQGLQSLVESERRRADAAEADRDAWRGMAEKPIWKRLFG